MRALLVSAVLALAVVLSACGGDDGGGGGGNGEFGALPEQQDTDGEKGGKLTVLAASDVDTLDPAATYYQFGFSVFSAMQRGLYAFEPDSDVEITPDLADGKAEISDDGRRVTVHLKEGIRFSPPVNREVTSADVKYAIERAFSENVQPAYQEPYFGFIKGSPEAQSGPYREIPGIKTPDDQTIVFELEEPYGQQLVSAMVLPITTPVPKEYAEKFDKENPSTYGVNQVFTGPYMIENNAEGKLTGYEPKKLIKLVRNPNWDEATDFRPAYLDGIEIRQGNDPVAASRRVLRGESLVTGDYTVPVEALREASENAPDQVALPASGANRYISLNTQVEPFDDINVRKAVIAGLDRDALRLTRGGPLLGDIPTHFLPPDFPGFEEAGGHEGFGLDYLANEKGDPELSAEYFRKAGFESGKYEGPPISFAGDSEEPGSKTFQVAADQFRKMGFKLREQQAKHEDLLFEICGTPKQRIAVCVNSAWAKDFNDAQTMLDLPFNGDHISPTNNVNHAMLDVPAVNKAIDMAIREIDPAKRAEAWARVDRLVMEQAPVVPYLWDKQASARSENVKGVINRFNANWDYSFTSLK